MPISTQARIKQLYKAANDEIEKQKRVIDELRERCLHPTVFRDSRSNTGNYDPSCDSYWIDCRCADCGKYWREDQ